MNISYNRKYIGEGISFSTIVNPSQKTNSIYIRLVTPLNEETVSMNSILPSILSNSNSKLPTITDLEKKLASLYGAGISFNCTTIGDSQVVLLYAFCLNDRYAFDNEAVTAELTDVLIDCLISPNVSGGGFAPDDFALKKQELIDEIEAEINEKRSFAFVRSKEMIFENEPAAMIAHGKLSQAKKLDNIACYENYKKLLSTAEIDISFVSSEENSAIEEKICNAFSKIDRADIVKNSSKPSIIKSETARLTEHYDVAQSKLILAFKSDYEDQFVINLLVKIYGGSPFSRLFLNVREKLSLCYYCAATGNEIKKTYFVDCGVEHENISKAEAEILRQLELLKQGEIDDEIIANTKLMLVNSIKSFSDSARSIAEWYFVQSYKGEIFSQDEYIAKINAVTKEDLVKAANSMVLDSVYLLTGKESL